MTKKFRKFVVSYLACISWLIQRLNGSKVNGKEAHFNKEEVLQLQSALNDLGKKHSSIVLL